MSENRGFRGLACFALCCACVWCGHGHAFASASVAAVHREARLANLTPNAAIFGMGFNFPARTSRAVSRSEYLSRLSLRLHLGRRPVGSRLVISLSVNGRASNRIEVVAKRSSRCRNLNSWNSVDLLRGFTKGVHCGGTFRIHSANFLQVDAVGRGASRLTVDAVGARGRGGRIMILPGSGVFATQRGPARIRFAHLNMIGALGVGKWKQVPFTLRNIGERAARAVRVRADSNPGLVVKVAMPPRSDSVAADSSMHGTLWVRPKHEGRFKVLLDAESTANHPGAELIFTTSNASAGDVRTLKGVALAVALAGLVLLVWSLWRSKSRRPTY